MVGEHVAVALHELLERPVGVLAGLARFEHGVEVVDHVLVALQRLGGHVGHGLRHPVELALEQLGAQLLHQLLELLARLGAGPVVVLQGLHLTGQVGGQQIERHAPLGRRVVGDVAPPLVAGAVRLVDQVVDAGPLGVEHLAQAPGDVLVGAAEVVALEQLLATLAQPLEQLAHAGHALAVAVLEPPLHQALEGLVQVTVVEDLVGQLVEDVISPELEAGLRAVPA